MFESLIGLVAIIALFVIISRQQSRIGLIERELGALRSLVLSGAHAVLPEAKPAEQAQPTAEPASCGRCRYRLAVGERNRRGGNAGG